MKKYTISLLAFSMIILSGASCKKKISKYPFDLYGIWYSENTSCGTFMELTHDQNGVLYGGEGANCPEAKTSKGKVKYRKDILYIDKDAFKIIENPSVANGNDSIWVPYQNTSGSTRVSKKYKVIATIKLQAEKTAFEFEKTYNFSKYIE